MRTSFDILCLGAAAIDRKYRAGRPLERDTSNPVEGSRSFGGVARNVAESLARLGIRTAFSSLVGADENGNALLLGLKALGIDTRHVRQVPGRRTAEYIAVLEPDGTLAFGLADMSIFEAFDKADLADLGTGSWVFADCNLPAPILEALAAGRAVGGFKLAVDAVSRAKAARLPRDLRGVDLLFLNEAEAEAYLGLALTPDAASFALRERGAAAVALTCGLGGLVAADEAGLHRIPAMPAETVDVTGAGDAFIAGTLAALLRGASLPEAARAGTAVASLTVEAPESVRHDLSPELVAAAMAAPARNAR